MNYEEAVARVGREKNQDKLALTMRRALPLDSKIALTRRRVREWYRRFDGEVYVAFSGGKDSTVLLDIVRSLYPDVPAAFCDTGLEFPEIRDFVKTVEDVVWLKPKMTFLEVIKNYGFAVASKENAQKVWEIRNSGSEKLIKKRMYGGVKGAGKLPVKWRFLLDAPFKISHKCCDVFKKNPSLMYERKTGRVPILGTMASDSSLREMQYLKHSCNVFDVKRPRSQPMSFWTDEDVWEYIRVNELPYCTIYDMGYKNTGCVFCMFGLHKQENDKFEMLEKTHPALYSYCMDKLGLRRVIEYVRRGGD